MNDNRKKELGYYVCSSCQNCQHVFCLMPVEGSCSYYCTHNRKNRPKHGELFFNVLINDFDHSEVWYDDKDDNEKFEKEMRLWDAWSDENMVEPNGVCNHHEKL
jgi:hypothetical protein